MGDQARALGISVAYISAIERGKRSVPPDYPADLARWMSLSPQDSEILVRLAAEESAIIKVFPKDSERALLAREFADGLNGLTREGIRELSAILESSKSGAYSEGEIRSRALLARAAFDVAQEISFDVLKIVENQLHAADPDFSLQVDADGSIGWSVQVFSEYDGKTVDRFLSTEWLYGAADRGTPESRYILAHELGHWILHRRHHDTHSFLRSSRGKILSKGSKIHIENEADFFAREFLMPLAVVERFSTPELLARAANVPLWAAQKRLREIRSLTRTEREEVNRLPAVFEKRVRPVTIASDSTTSAPRRPMMQGDGDAISAVVLPFPRMPIIRHPLPRKKLKKQASLPLFEYADAMRSQSVPSSASRADQWFAEFGWRGD